MACKNFIIVAICFAGFSFVSPTNETSEYREPLWTWISGSSTIGDGAYIKRGVPYWENEPASRFLGASWQDSKKNLWMFGGAFISGKKFAFVNKTEYFMYNDLWKFDGFNWTWVSGNESVNLPGQYGIKGIADEKNIPGARQQVYAGIDSNDNLWIYGGYGFSTDSDCK